MVDSSAVTPGHTLKWRGPARRFGAGSSVAGELERTANQSVDESVEAEQKPSTPRRAPGACHA